MTTEELHIMNNKRELGYWETTCKYGHDMFAGSGNVVAMMEIVAELNVDRLINALTCLYQRQPALQASLFDESHHYYFHYHQNLVEMPFTVHEVADWQTVVEDQMHEKFNVSQCLWRACLNQQADRCQLLIAIHHGACDGYSAILLLQEWLAIYHQLNLHEAIEIETLPVMAAIEDQLAQKNDWKNFLNHRQKYQPQNLTPWAFHKLVPLAERKTRLIYKTVDAKTLYALKLQCKEKLVTINSALNAALLFAIQCNVSEPLHTTLHTPVNLRRYARPSIADDHIGCFISMVMTEHQLKITDNFWSVASAYQKQLQERIPLLGFCPCEFAVANFDLGELMLLFDMVASSKRKTFTCGFGISNLGQIQLDNQFTKPTKLMFCTNRIVGDFIIFLNVLSYADTLHLGFCYPEPLVEKEWVLKVIADFELILLNTIVENAMATT